MGTNHCHQRRMREEMIDGLYDGGELAVEYMRVFLVDEM